MNKVIVLMIILYHRLLAQFNIRIAYIAKEGMRIAYIFYLCPSPLANAWHF